MRWPWICWYGRPGPRTGRGPSACWSRGVFDSAARRITEAVSIPTIGIGASAACDGQVLVTEDVLGLFSDYTPKFAKKYVDLSVQVREVFAEFEREARTGAFPAAEHCFGIKK
ncbi:3-methyl-2-oxobutanoate hydroxymethyltransferase [Microbulbifer rhizosphaerae]|uniref:3-methyl-2-oxobutanoate hydroxymethyltransferase n=1 Tax=Microbulbifer rhizosphaerae TaxID=1562603 RepID=UPI001C859404